MKQKLVALIKAGHTKQAEELWKSLGETVDLSGADLSSADLTDAIYNDQTRWPDGVDLAPMHRVAPDADLQRLNLSGASLFKENRRHANLSHANLTGADLRTAFITGAVWTGAQYNTTPLTPNGQPTRFPPGFDPQAAGMVPIAPTA
ncbi:MAG: pentapeptide repeat-containing protein [Myxococcota bacterium]